MNPEVFPEPEDFKPERWNNSTPEMERSLVPFSKGKRMCPGKEFVTYLLPFISSFKSSQRPKLISHGHLAGYRLWSCTLSSRRFLEGSKWRYSIPRKFQALKTIHVPNQNEHTCRREDFNWKVYISLHFKGRFFHAILKPRPGFSGSGHGSVGIKVKE